MKKVTETRNAGILARSVVGLTPAIRRVAMVLLVLVLHAAVALADEMQMEFFYSPDGCGTAEADGIKVKVTPEKGYLVTSVQWSDVDSDGNNVGEIRILDLFPDGYYYAPKTYGHVYVFFVSITDDVLVTFSMNGHGGEAPQDQMKKIGETADMPTPNPTADGYAFLGWFDSNIAEEPYDFSTPLTSTAIYNSAHNCTVLRLYARWAALSDLSGSCGEQLTWQIDQSDTNGLYDVLTISGCGDMNNYKSNNQP